MLINLLISVIVFAICYGILVLATLPLRDKLYKLKLVRIRWYGATILGIVVVAIAMLLVRQLNLPIEQDALIWVAGMILIEGNAIATRQSIKYRNERPHTENQPILPSSVKQEIGSDGKKVNVYKQEDIEELRKRLMNSK